jgi:hypothetical protein
MKRILYSLLLFIFTMLPLEDVLADDSFIPKLVSPIGGTIIDISNPAFQWYKQIPVGDVVYQIQISTNVDFTGNLFLDTTLTTCRIRLTVAPSTQYYWRVRMTNTSSNNSFCAADSFSTKDTLSCFVAPIIFPLKVGNAWYYRCYNSSLAHPYYYMTKTISDSLGDGKYNVKVNEIHDTAVSVSNEVWQYINEEFSIGDNKVYYDYMQSDTSYSEYSVNYYQYSQKLTKDTIWGQIFSTQIWNYQVNYPYSAGSIAEVKTAKYLGPYYSTSSYLSTRPNMSYSTYSNYNLICAKIENVIIGDSTEIQMPKKPMLISPQNFATKINTPTTLAWVTEDTTAFTMYRVRIATDSLFQSIVLDSSNIILRQLSVSGLTAGMKYYWRVCPQNVASVGDYTEAFAFTTLSCQLPAAPITDSVIFTPKEHAVTCSWYSLRNVGEVQYKVQIAEDTAFAVLICDAITADTSLYYSNIQAGVVYYWRVSAFNLDFVSPYSSVKSFRIKKGNDITTQLVLPDGGAKVNEKTHTVTCSWHRLTGVDVTGYQIQIAVASSFAGMRVDTVVTDTNLIIKNLVGGSEYYWRVRAIDYDYSSPYSETQKFKTVFPAYKFVLYQNYPNPFNPSTTISYEVAEAGRVSIHLYGVLGNEAATLLDENQLAGYYELRVNLSNLPSGVYIYKLQQGGNIQSKKLILLK